jgi:uncharacterized protein YjbI with pentapeptide repeats
MTYKILNNLDGVPYAVLLNGKDSIPFDPANTDYANFKKEVLAGAELQDADGNVMTQADAYIASLP